MLLFWLEQEDQVATRRESVSTTGFEEGSIFRLGFVVGFLMESMRCHILYLRYNILTPSISLSSMVLYESSQYVCTG